MCGVNYQADGISLQRLAAINLLNSMSVRSFAHVLALKKRMVLVGHVSGRLMVSALTQHPFSANLKQFEGHV